jgi:dihydrolipoamide dehydrogenase
VAGAVEESLLGKQVIIATGSNARALPGTPFDEERILSNDGALQLMSPILSQQFHISS